MSPAAVPKIKLNNGYEIPVIGMGTWPGSPEPERQHEIKQAVSDALEIGYRHFDCAHFYQNEDLIGQAIEEKIKSGLVARQDLFITSKLWNNYHRAELVESALRTTLGNLKLDYLDLYLIHWPVSFVEGDDLWPLDDQGNFIEGHVDFVETWKAMEEVVKKGLVRSIGVSNFNSRQIERLMKSATITPVTNQVECHPLLNQNKLRAFCKERDITLTSYCPLGGPYKSGGDSGNGHLLDDGRIKAISNRIKKTTAQVLIKYNVQSGNIVIPKSANRKRLSENIDVFDFTLTPGDMAFLSSLHCNGRITSFEPARKLKEYPFDAEF